MLLVPWKNIVSSRNYCWSKVSACVRDFQLHVLKIEFKNYLILHVLSNHPKTFRICSRDHLKEMSQTEF